MAVYLDTVTPPVLSVGANPSQQRPWKVATAINGTERSTLGGRGADVLYTYRDIGPLTFLALTVAQYNAVDAKLNTALTTGATLYLQLPDSSTIYAGYVPAWAGTPKSYGGGVILWDLDFTFKESIRP